MDKTLLHILYDEFQSNGGHFQSSEADYIFRQAFSEEYNETATEIFNRLITNKSPDVVSKAKEAAEYAWLQEERETVWLREQ